MSFELRRFKKCPLIKDNSVRSILLLVIIGCLCGACATTIHEQQDWKTFTSGAGKYQIIYPADWDARVAVPPAGIGPFYEPDILLDDEIQKVTFLEKQYDVWQGEFQVKVMANPKDLTLQQWADEFEVEDVMEKSETKLSGYPALKYSLFGYDHTIIEILSVYDGKLYCLSFAGANPNDPDIERHRRIYSRMLAGFSFLLLN
jgi:hypothetical protein